MSAQPRAGVGSDGQLARLLWLVLFSYYLLILGGHHYSIDGIVMFESARQLFFHHSLVLDPPVVWGISVYRVSPYGIGLVLAYLPLLALQSPLLSWLPALQAIPYNPAVAYEGKVRPHVDRAFSFADAPAAHAYIQDRKVLLVP